MSEYNISRMTIDEYIASGRIPPKRFDSTTIYYLNTVEGEVVGEIAFKKESDCDWPDCYFILKIISQNPNNGIASSLVSAVEGEAIDENIGMIKLRYNRPNLWKKLGYEIDGARHFASKQLKIHS